MKQLFLFLVAGLGLTIMPVHGHSGDVHSNPEDLPNIIFLFADDLGWGDLSCYGSKRLQTPSLDHLAKEGTLFTQFYVAGSVCSPSRCAIMTGQYPTRNRVFGHFSSHEGNMSRAMPDALDPDLLMLTDVLKERGYTTGHFGKWHLGNISPSKYGFDVFMSSEFSNVRGGELLDIWSPEYRSTCTKSILDETLHFIKENRDGPVYVNVWFSDVHGILNPSRDQLEAVENHKPKSWNGEVNFYGVEQIYLAALKEMDMQIGLFLSALEEMGMAENTLIIFSSDNGPEDYQIADARHSGVGSNGPFRGRKRSIYEGGIRVPFILRWTGRIPQNKVNNATAINGVDLLPTIASIVGADFPGEVMEKMDGEDMSDVWLGGSRKRVRTQHWEWRFRVHGHVLNRSPMIAVREGDYKLLMNPDSSRIELYNIIEDPSEMQNLYKLHPERTAALMKEAIEWYTELPYSSKGKFAGENTWDWPGD